MNHFLARMAVLLIVGSVLHSAPAQAEDRFTHEGSLAVAAPAFTTGVSETTWLRDGSQDFQGIDAVIVELPASSDGRFLTVTGTSPAPFDLDVWFYNARGAARRISSCVSPSTNAQCVAPRGVRYAVVIANRGVDIDFVLEMDAPSDCSTPQNDPNYLEPEVGFDGTATVVAVIDSGTNFFHDVFARPQYAGYGNVPVRAVDATTGVGARYLPIDRSDPFDCQRWVLDAMQPKTLYRAGGTNAFFISMGDQVDGYDRNGHGSWVAGAVANNGPDVVIVGVQVSGGSSFFADAAKGLEWAAAQPWIDVVTLSIAPSGDFTAPGPFLDASKAARDAGKLVFFAAGNSPRPTQDGDSAGPPWVVSVGGADQYRKGEGVLPSKLPDVLGDFTTVVADATGYSATVPVSGTSLATPSVAGAVGQALYEARVAAGHTGPMRNGHLIDTPDVIAHADDLRRAMNYNAVYWTATDYDPLAVQPYEPGREYAISQGVAVNPVAPWLQMGWGYVNGDLASAIAQTLVTGEYPVKPPEAVAFMGANQAVRQSLWSGAG